MSNDDTPVFDKTLSEADLPDETKQEIKDATNASHDSSTSFTSGPADPPSPLLDSEDGDSDWDAEGFTPPTLEEMPTEGPGSPGFDVYAPENAEFQEPVPMDNHDDEDVKAALESETADGVGETDPEDLPESDVDPNEEKAEDYPDLEPRGDDVPSDEESK